MERRITSWNNKAEELTGYTRDEVIGKKCDIFSLQSCYGVCGVYSGEVKKPIVAKECEVRTKNGDIRIISKNADLLRGADGRIIGAVESFEDITGTKQVERQLRTERDKLMAMLSALGQGMHILNKEYGIEYQNEVLRRHFGDKLGHKCYEVYKQRAAPCEICRMHEALDSMEIQRTELLMADGRYYEQSYAPFRDIDRETKALILLRDITEEKAHQAETMRAGQLASIGELAAGVAHEINNPINGIINYAQILLDETENSANAEMHQRIIKEGERIAEIVRNLLFFARQRDEEAEVVRVEDVIDDSLALIKHQFQKDGIIMTLEKENNLPEIRVNPQQLQQVFLNLLSNARHALNERYPARDLQKKIEIRSQQVKIRNRKYVRTSFKDWGTGISPEIIGKIFDPFFSSKEPGEGTGLGLSISHGLVKDFNGSLQVESEPGRYTAMTVDLPAYESSPA
jgi:PAS domain S-box-containing protein